MWAQPQQTDWGYKAPSQGFWIRAKDVSMHEDSWRWPQPTRLLQLCVFIPGAALTG